MPSGRDRAAYAAEPQTHRRRPRGMVRRLAVTVVVVAAILIAQAVYCVRVKVPEVSPDVFSAAFTGVASFGRWSIGYADGTHGAALARSTGAPRADGREPEACAGLTEAMRREWEALPWKFALETALYVTVFSAAAVLVAVRPRTARGRLVWCLYAPTVLVLLAGAPCAIWCYGASIYSTYVGPCWASRSGGWLTVTLIPADTVSYRSFLEAVAWLPMVVARAARVEAIMPGMPMGWGIYLVACPVYVLCTIGGGTLFRWSADLVARRRTRG